MLTLEAGGQKNKTFFEVLERQNMKNHTIFNLYTDDNNSKYSSTFLNLEKIEKLYTKWTSTAATTEFVHKISINCLQKSINSETNNKPPGNNGLTAEFYKHSSNELAPVLLDVYDSWGKLDTMGVADRREIISAIY